MHLRRIAALLCLLLCAVAFPTNIEVVFAGGKPIVRTASCHDGVWDDGEYCGRDAYVTTNFPEMNHDCLIDGLDVGLFLNELYTSGVNLSADFNDDGQVDVFNDYFVFAPKVGSDVDPCNGSPTPSVQQGTIALSLSPNPQTIVTSQVLTPGHHDIYVVINGFTNAKYVEYAIWTTQNVFIVADSMMVPGLTGPSCNAGTYNVVHAFATPIVSGPTTINRFTVDVTALAPGALTIAPANCSWAKVRWARESADFSFNFNVQNLDFNQPGTYGTVTGKAFIDRNGDCVFNGGDTPVGSRLIVTSPGSYGAGTDSNGNYALNAPPGNYTVTFAPYGNDPWKFSDCQGPYSVTLTAGQTVVGKDFGLRAIGTVSGKVFRNLAFGPCSFEPPIDNVMPGRAVIANPGGYKTLSKTNGDYSLTLPAGNYDVEYSTYTNDAFAPNYCQPVPMPVTITPQADSPNNNIALVRTGPPHCGTTLNFYMLGPVESSCPHGHPWLTSCPGHASEYDVVLDVDLNNTFAASASSTLDIVLDPAFTINDISCNWPFTEVSSTGPNNKKISLDDPLWPGLSVVVTLHATPSSNGPYHAHVTFDDLGYCDGIKTKDIDELSFCSCDPNDMKVDPEGCGQNHEVVGNAPFKYSIRFENIGEGSAHNIVVRDVIDPNLDTSTLKVIAASHTVTGWQIGPNNELEIDFDGINLSGTIGPGGNTGFVMFSADPLPNLPNGTTIQNSAAITFDYNDPVITNTVSNAIQSNPCPTAVSPPVFATYLSQNHPNPFNPATTIEYGLKSRSKVSIAIYNVAGQLIRVLVSGEKPAGQYHVEWDGRDQQGSPVASGVYLSRMRAGSYSDTKKLILLK